jgi:PadR family transcriptional regulator PadR
MKIENIKSQMRKGVLEYCILNILSQKEAAYTSDILQELKDAKMIVVEGTVYPLLTRLKNSGYLSYRWEESTSGPPRKYYVLTSEGEKFLQLMQQSWEELVSAVNHINQNTLNTKKSNR